MKKQICPLHPTLIRIFSKHNYINVLIHYMMIFNVLGQKIFVWKNFISLFIASSQGQMYCYWKEMTKSIANSKLSLRHLKHNISNVLNGIRVFIRREKIFLYSNLLWFTFLTFMKHESNLKRKWSKANLENCNLLCNVCKTINIIW